MRDKIILTVIFIIMINSLSFAIDCYGNWLTSFDVATNEYSENQERCRRALWPSPSFCFKEADMIYTHALDAASSRYNDCVMNGKLEASQDGSIEDKLIPN